VKTDRLVLRNHRLVGVKFCRSLKDKIAWIGVMKFKAADFRFLCTMACQLNLTRFWRR